MTLTEAVIEDESGNVSLVIHLDHGKKLETIRACSDLGFSSVHMDASELPFQQNIRLTKEAAEIAHARGLWVQGELGSIYGKEGLIKLQQGEPMENIMTKPEQVEEFISRTGVDTVAVSIGTMHGNFIGQENIDFKRLELIRQKTKTPIVLHGGSGVPDGQLKQAIAGGVRIINVDTDLRMVFANTLKEVLKVETDLIDPRKILAPVIAAAAGMVEAKIRLFNS